MARWLAYRDKDQQLWLYDTKTKQPKLIAQSMVDDFSDLTWSPDSQWLAYVEAATNTFTQIKVLNTKTGAIQAITSDRYNSLHSGLELGWQVALLSFGPHVEDDRGVALGRAAAGP